MVLAEGIHALLEEADAVVCLVVPQVGQTVLPVKVLRFGRSVLGSASFDGAKVVLIVDRKNIGFFLAGHGQHGIASVLFDFDAKLCFPVSVFGFFNVVNRGDHPGRGCRQTDGPGRSAFIVMVFGQVALFIRCGDGDAVIEKRLFAVLPDHQVGLLVGFQCGIGRIVGREHRKVHA